MCKRLGPVRVRCSKYSLILVLFIIKIRAEICLGDVPSIHSGVGGLANRSSNPLLPIPPPPHPPLPEARFHDVRVNFSLFFFWSVQATCSSRRALWNVREQFLDVTISGVTNIAAMLKKLDEMGCNLLG